MGCGVGLAQRLAPERECEEGRWCWRGLEKGQVRGRPGLGGLASPQNVGGRGQGPRREASEPLGLRKL